MSFANTSARRIIAASIVLMLTACSTTSRLEGAAPGTTLAIKGIERIELPRTENLASKSTGNYEFMATAPDGKKVYGLLPLKVNGGTMAMSILFFAPALFIGGFRDVFPFYQVDPEKSAIRYKMNESDAWNDYVPLAAEAKRAQDYFDTLKPR
ncbi:hypothetical protein BH11PSE11_BH11PSE11_02880 [soil metagenome]